jgi:hypothetical protein
MGGRTQRANPFNKWTQIHEEQPSSHANSRLADQKCNYHVQISRPLPRNGAHLGPNKLTPSHFLRSLFVTSSSCKGPSRRSGFWHSSFLTRIMFSSLFLQALHSPFHLNLLHIIHEHGLKKINKFGASLYAGLTQIPGTRWPWRLNCVRWHLIFVGRQYGTCFMSPFWQLRR